MGQKASCSATSTQICPHGVLVVHSSGQAEDFPTAMKVKEVLREQSDSHFVCRWKDVQLHSHAVSPLKAEEELRMGEIYMVMPISLLHSDVSPRALVAMGYRMLAGVKKEASKHRSKRRRADGASMGRARSCKMHDKLLGSCENQELQLAYKEHLHLLEKNKSWKPRLYTIEESSWVR